MTPKIRVLPDSLKNLIAAGEVVERPASVVKELLENSIDAGARTIDVAVDGGGRTRIAVADDGSGMDPEDAVRSFSRHATSKIHDAADLTRISTLGFRGEALPAMAAVSDLTLLTRSADSDHATEVRVQYGRRDLPKEGARAPGTTVEVRQLFARTPARARFLKSRATEVKWIQQVFSAYALAHPEIAFTLSLDGRRQASYPGGMDRPGRVREVLGEDLPWCAVGPARGTVEVEGMVSGPEVGRASTDQLFFFVNGRWVANRALLQGLLRAHGPFLAKGRYPAGAIFLEVPEGAVDVNVHPTKKEVRFREAGRVVEEVSRAAEECLRDRRRGRLEAPETTVGAGTGRVREAGPAYRPGARAVQIDSGLGLVETPAVGDAEPSVGPRLLAVLAETYLLAVDGDDLVLIDQHAAHERILYEEAERALEGRAPASQSLLLPLTLDLTPPEARTFGAFAEEIVRLGFDVEPFGGRSVLVRAVPAGLKRWDNGQALRDMLDQLGEAGEEGEEPGAGRSSKVAASFACHTSVRAGDRLSVEERTALIARLFRSKDWHRCPHGRPTVVRLERAEIERRFRRP